MALVLTAMAPEASAQYGPPAGGGFVPPPDFFFFPGQFPGQNGFPGQGGPLPGMPGPGAPGDMPGPMVGVNPLDVLKSPAVQDELKLADDQKTQVTQLYRTAATKAREMFQGFQNGGANPQSFMTAGNRLRQDNDRAIGKMLKTNQKDRLKEIVLRVEGPMAIGRSEVASKLGLTSAQSRQVQGTMMQLMQAMREQFEAGGPEGQPFPIPAPNADGKPNAPPNGAPGAPGNGPDVNQMPLVPPGTFKLREAAGQQVLRILNAKQKEAYQKMLGEPFDISKIDPELGHPVASAAGAADSDPSDTGKAAARKKRSAAPKRGTAKADPKSKS
jgi:hypothetical protein